VNQSGAKGIVMNEIGNYLISLQENLSYVIRSFKKEESRVKVKEEPKYLLLCYFYFTGKIWSFLTANSDLNSALGGGGMA
jgi:hypothetical protein